MQLGTRLIDLLIESAYIQPPVNQDSAASFEIRPAFRHYIAKASGYGYYDFFFFVLDEKLYLFSYFFMPCFIISALIT